MAGEDQRPLAQTLGSAAVGLGLGLAILGLGFVVSRITLPESTVAAAMTSSPIGAPTATPKPVLATPSPSPTATPKPTDTPDPMTVSAFTGQNLRLAAITLPAGYTFRAPFAGKVSIALYQYVDGNIRTGVAGQPTYPYIFITAADREIKIRPGAIDRDIQMIVKDGDTVEAGAPLFKTLTTGASSWATFYDSNVSAQVVVSAVSLPGAAGIDPVPIFKR